jgi:hypothetical protein
MSDPSERRLTRDRAWACIRWNIATPGVGSFRAGRIFTGLCQLALLIGGVFLICAWVLRTIYGILLQQFGEPARHHPIGWMWKIGMIGFAASGLWVFFTCVDLHRQAEMEERKNPQNVPPRLADLPKKKSEKQ